MAKRRGRFPRRREEIEQLSGVGQYICNAILMFDQGISEPLLDSNLARVLERLFGPRKLRDIRYDPYLQKLAWRVVQHQTPARLNWAFLDLAAAVCIVREPRCPICPLQKACCYVQSHFADTSAPPG
jgi:A/G-specific adenine glycosylase